MAEIVRLIGHRMGGRPGEYLMHRLGMLVAGAATTEVCNKIVGS